MFTRSFIRSGLLAAAALACLFSLGLPGSAHAGPVFSSETPRLGLSRTAAASRPAAVQPANIGNPAPAAGTEKRVALVIGNSAYENVTALPNPANDAKAIGKFLNSAGFEVIQATDLDHDEMIQVLQDFSARISERGPDTVAFVYYAGHGVQIAGENYLVPVDARIGSEADVPNAAIRLVDVMATLQAVPSRMRIVLLDACRNNPFSQLKDAGRGLAIVDAPNGSIVGYSTAPGTEAFDGDGANSPYTTAFLRVAGEQNLPIERVFKQVRVAVNEATDGKQTPWESSSLTSDFYFFGDTVMAAARNIDTVASANASASETRSAVASNVRTRNPRDAYRYVVAEDSVASYEEFVRAYPQDPFADRVRKLLASKLLALAWHGAVAANSPPAYKAFYSQYSDSPYASLAMRLENQPKLMPLYQPTRIMVAPQLAPRIRLSNFNGVSIPQGDSAPIGLGGRGSLFNKGFAKGQPLPAPVTNAGGMMPNGPAKSPMPGIDLAKSGKRFDTRIDGGRFSTLPSSGPKAVMNGPGAGPIGRDAKVMDRRVYGRPQVGPEVSGKRFEPSRIADRPANRIRNRPAFDRQPAANRFQPAPRMQVNGNAGAGRKAVWSSPKPVSFGGGGGNSGGRFAGGGFGRSFR